MWKTVGEFFMKTELRFKAHVGDVFAAKDKKPVDVKHEMSAYEFGFSSTVGQIIIERVI